VCEGVNECSERPEIARFNALPNSVTTSDCFLNNSNELVGLNKCLFSQRHEDAWGERRYSSYSFSTSELDGGEWSASRPGRALSPGKGPPVPIVQEAGWAPEPVWTQRLEEESFLLCWGSNDDRWIVQPVDRLCTD
jgi:hypothetical protein